MPGCSCHFVNSFSVSGPSFPFAVSQQGEQGKEALGIEKRELLLWKQFANIEETLLL